MVHLWPYIWPADRRDLKLRVLAAMALLVAAKVATIAVPFTFKYATDALAGHPDAAGGWLGWAIAAPVAMTLAYGGMRMLMAALTQGRDAVFAKVAMHAVRRIAYLTFVHMHELSLRFHLERKTGGLTRVLERGRNAIETIVRMVILQLAPTVIEVTLVAAVLMVHFDWRYVALIVGTVALYMGWTYNATEWRIGIRRKHERQRYRRQCQGDRLAAQLRDRQIFRRRAARGLALRPLDGALRGRQRQVLHLAHRAQCRPGDPVHHRARRPPW